MPRKLAPRKLGGLLDELAELSKECMEAEERARGMRSASRQAQRARSDMHARAIRYAISNASKLRATRLRLGLPQKAIAQAARVKQPYVSYLEAGKVTEFGPAALVRMLEAYGEL